MSLSALEFEMPRRNILFHSETEMPDLSLLGYTGDPNSANPANTAGEALLYNSPSGTMYVDKGVDPYDVWIKVQDSGGGDWSYLYSDNAIIDGGDYTP